MSLVPEGCVSIGNFGAKCDGKTDNQAALNLAVAEAARRGMDVFIPDGIFRTSSFNHPAGVRLRGVKRSRREN